MRQTGYRGLFSEKDIDPLVVLNIMRGNPVEISERKQPLRGFAKEFFF